MIAWPPALPGLGAHRAGPYRACLDCAAGPPQTDHGLIRGHRVEVPHPIGTWTAYGTTPVCPHHARRRARGQETAA